MTTTHEIRLKKLQSEAREIITRLQSKPSFDGDVLKLITKMGEMQIETTTALSARISRLERLFSGEGEP